MSTSTLRQPYRHLYVHVPFCARRCSYCDFAIAVRKQVPIEAFVDDVMREIDTRGLSAGMASLDTVYLGGGTPSLLGGDGIRRLFRHLADRAEIAPGAEVTLEANPEDISPRSVADWREAGITRLSVGVQSFDDAVLQWMHRIHDASAARAALEIARRGGLSAFSLDLIFAVPAALKRDWHRDLDLALALEPDHISLYGLTVEPQTPLGRWQARGDVAAASDERYADEFLEANARLTAAGYEHYEVSNFARPGHRAIHNAAYWSGVPYLGVGPSAHGFDGRSRRWNMPAFAAWRTTVESGCDPVDGEETLTDANRAAERVYLGLRTRTGLAVTAEEEAAVAPWVAAGWLEWVAESTPPCVRCTPNGWLVLDKLAGDLTAVPSRS